MVAKTNKYEQPADMLVDYINWKYHTKPEERDMLLQAYDMRSLIVLLDGIDEAAGFRQHIEEYVVHELAPMGMRVVATARPEVTYVRMIDQSDAGSMEHTLTHTNTL
eukprot:1185152-Prorocentrum_minimum.AAC.3